MLEVNIEKDLPDFHLSSFFTVQKEILGILGPSGSGKSMTLKCIAGLDTPSSGRIILNDRILFDSHNKINLPPQARKIGFVFQNYALFPHLTVAKNIAFGIQHLPKEERQVQALNMIERMELIGLENRYPHELSGGQQQRVSLARTFVTNPDLLLLDEPFSALDTHVKSQLQQELLSMIQDHYEGAILFITHNLEEAYMLCDRILMYENGTTVQLGHKEEIINRPANLTVAKMTGCKNFIPVEILREANQTLILSAGEWIFTAPKQKQAYKDKMIAGFHSYHAKLVTAPENENTFACQIKAVTEMINTINIVVHCSGFLFTVNMTKEEWSTIHTYNQPIFLHIPANHIFLVPHE